MIRVAVKAASPVTQAGLERLLQEDPEIELIALDDREGSVDVIVAEATGGESTAELLEDLPPPGQSMILLLDDVQSAGVLDMLKAGVKGVLPRSSSSAEILAGVHAVAEGLVVLDSSAVEGLPSAARLGSQGSDLIEPLTTRELEVLRLLAEGLGNKEIASCLNISEHTAKFHVASILGKLGATTRTEAVTLGIRYGLIMI